VKGLVRIESVVGALVEVLHAFTTGGRDIVPLLCKLYVRMLLFEVIYHDSVRYCYFIAVIHRFAAVLMAK